MPDAHEHELPSLPITYRPPILAVAGWFIACTVIGAAFYVVFRIVLDFPIWAQSIVGFLVMAAFGSGVVTARSFVRFSGDGITQRFLGTKQYDWASLAAWTQWGANGSTFVRTNTGKVFGFNQWCVSGSRNRDLYAILSRHIGAETKGDDAVLPAIMKRLTKIVTSNLAPDATEQRDQPERRSRAN